MDHPDRPPTPEEDTEVTDATDGPTRASLVAKAKTEKQRVVARAAGARDQLEARRDRSTTVDAALRALERDSEIGGGVLAAAVGFRVFLFLVPYVFVWVAGFGIASDAADRSPEAVARDAGITGLVARSLGDFGNVDLGERLVALVLGLFALYLASRALVRTLVVVHVLVWGDVDRRNVSSSKGAAVLVALVTASVAVSVAVGWARQESFVAGLVGIVLYMAVPLGLWIAVSRLLPHAPEIPWWSLLPGAVVVALGVEALHVVTVYWISREISSKADRYGALGVALALLLWAYLLGRLVVTATVVNAALWRNRLARANGPLPAPPSAPPGFIDPVGRSPRSSRRPGGDPV